MSLFGRKKLPLTPGNLYLARGVFQSQEALKDFMSDLMPVLSGNPGKVDAGIRGLVAKYSGSLRTRDLGRIYFTILYELLEHEEEIQHRVFHLLPFLTERGQLQALTAIIDQSRFRSVFVDAIRRIQDLSQYFQRKKLYNSVLKRLKKELNAKDRKSREDSLKLILELPDTFRLQLLRFIFRSSFLHHHVQQKSISYLNLLSPEAMVRMIERIVKLRDADENLVQECINIIPSMDLPVRPKVLKILLRNAPYDLVAIKSVEALQFLPSKQIPVSLYENAAKTIAASFRLDNPSLQLLAASMISRFPEPYLSRLIRKCLEISDSNTRALSLKYILGLGSEKKNSLLMYVFESLSAGHGNAIVISRAVRMIPTVEKEKRDLLYQMAAHRILSDLEEIERHTHLYEGLSVLHTVHLIPDLKLRERILMQGEKSILSVLGDSRKARQLFAVEQIHFLPESRHSLLIQKALLSESYDVILSAGKMIRSEVDKELYARYLEQLILHRLKVELVTWSLPEICDTLDLLSPLKVVEVFGPLRSMRLFPVRDIVRVMSERLIRQGYIGRKPVEYIFEYIKSDNEKANFLHDFIYGNHSLLAGLPWKSLRPFFRLARERLKRKEKGFTEDMTALLLEIHSEKIDPSSEFTTLRDYFKEEGLHLFDSMIYSRYREMDRTQRIHFLQTIRTLIDSILYGESYAKLKKRIESSGIENQVNSDFIFAILLQLIPIDSPHMSRQDARSIFSAAVRNELNIQNDLKKVSSGLLADDSHSGFTIARPSYEVRRSQSKPFDDIRVRDFFASLEALEKTGPDGLDLFQVIRSETSSEVFRRFKNFAMHELSDSFQECQIRYENPDNRYGVYLNLLEYTGETLTDLVHRGVNRLRQKISRNELSGAIDRLSNVLSIAVREPRYSGGMKPGSMIRLLRKEYRECGMSLDLFLNLYLLPIASNEKGVLSWNRVIEFLEDPGAGEFQDASLARDLRQTISLRNSESHNRLYLKSKQKVKPKDPIHLIFDKIRTEVFGSLEQELREAIQSFDTEEVVQVSDISYRIGKSSWLSIFGGLADICIAKDSRLFALDHFTLVSMIQDQKFVGFILVHLIREEDEKVMVLAGCEPSANFAAKHSPKQIYEQSVDVLVEFARKGNYDRVVQIADENAYSNRENVKRFIKSTIAAGQPDGRLRKPLYLGSYGVTSFRSRFYYTLWDSPKSGS